MDKNQRPGLQSHSKPTKSVRNSQEDGVVRDGQVAHTLTACCRCRHRKTRCDPGLPRCNPCRKTNAVCDYFDATRGKKMPRAYVLHLQNKVRQLEQTLANIADEPRTPFVTERLVREGSFVTIKAQGEDPRFLGPSSGIAMTRLVMEMAKNIDNAQSINEIFPEHKAHQIRQRFAQEASKPTSKIYPDVSFVAAPNLPSLDLTEKLVENFYFKVQFLYPVFHEPSFQEVVRDVYQGSSDPYKNFALRMVIAVSMQKLDTMYAGLADSYYLAALQFLENTLSAKNIGSLQSLALIGLYSMTTPTRTAAYWIVGLATRLCQELRMTDEATISCDELGEPYNTVEVDLRRRLFWICLASELGLAHSLGRPSAFSISHDHVDVNSFFMVDDKYIRPTGIIPGSPVSMKKKIAMHFMKMRLLQLEIRRTLYTRKRAYPADDSDPWFVQMEAKIKDWMASCPTIDEGSGVSKTWFQARYNTIVVLLFRPSPQVPEPSVRAAKECFDASKFNIQVQRQQISAKSVDLTWIFTQSLFMAINTMLWTLSYPDIRREHTRSEVDGYLETALEAIYLSSMKWPGVESAFELYTTLVGTCRKAYDGDPEAFYSIPSLALKAESTSPQGIGPNPTLPFGTTMHGSPQGTTSTGFHQSSPDLHNQTKNGLKDTPGGPALPLDSNVPSPTSYEPTQATATTFNSDRVDASGAASNGHLFDPSLFTNPLPPPLTYGYDYSSNENVLGRGPLYSAFEEPYARLMFPEFAHRDPANGLDLERQSELMGNLESNGLHREVSNTAPGYFWNTTNRTS